MDTAWFLICTALILIVSFIGAYLPMTTRTTDRELHLMVAFSAGVFMGILILILLPEAINESMTDGIFDNAKVMHVMYLVVAGFMIMFIVDFLLKHYRESECDCEECVEHHSHEIGSISAFVGLSIHASLDGLALATAFLVGENIGLMILVALCLHKGVEVFSLSSTLLLGTKRDRSSIYIMVFCFITPVAAILSYLLLSGNVESDLIGLAFAFSAGVFMFVTMLHMIPEAFHRRDIDIKSLALMVFGLVIVMFVVMIMSSSSL